MNIGVFNNTVSKAIKQQLTSTMGKRDTSETAVKESNTVFSETNRSKRQK